jgi:hypothetical protein
MIFQCGTETRTIRSSSIQEVIYDAISHLAGLSAVD